MDELTKESRDGLLANARHQIFSHFLVGVTNMDSRVQYRDDVRDSELKGLSSLGFNSLLDTNSDMMNTLMEKLTDAGADFDEAAQEIAALYNIVGQRGMSLASDVLKREIIAADGDRTALAQRMNHLSSGNMTEEEFFKGHKEADPSLQAMKEQGLGYALEAEEVQVEILREMVKGKKTDAKRLKTLREKRTEHLNNARELSMRTARKTMSHRPRYIA